MDKNIRAIMLAAVSLMTLSYIFKAGKQKHRLQAHQALPGQNYNGNGVMVKNDITRDDLGYYKMFSWHYPAEFKVKINGQEVASGQSAAINDSKIVVDYQYAWKTPWGKKTGTKQATFIAPKGMKNLTLAFNGWKADNRIDIAHAHRQSEEITLENSGTVAKKRGRRRRK